jgi:rsbT antagonist protein RsbS
MRNPELPSAPQPPLVSILRQGGYLIASIHTALDDTQLQRFQRDLIEQVGRYRARGIIIDVAALDVVDSYATHTLRTLAHVAKLRGAVTVIVGINPEVAFTMVRLGMNLDPVHTARDLDEGLALLDSLATGRRDQPTDRSLLRHRPVL